MTIYVPVESLADELTNHLRTTPTSLELALCNIGTWSNPPTEAEIIASVIADTNGYTKQDVTPANDAIDSNGQAEITFANASISLTSGTLDYSGFCIIRNGTEVVYAQSFTTTRTIDSAGAAHPFNNIKMVRNPVAA